MRRVRRYIEYNNIIILAVGLEFFRLVAIVTVKDKQLIFTLHTKYYIEIEILNLIHTFLISNLPVISYYNALEGWKVAFLILVGKVVLPS